MLKITINGYLIVPINDPLKWTMVEDKHFIYKKKKKMK